MIRNSQFSDLTHIRSAQLDSTGIRTRTTRFDSHLQNLDSNPSLDSTRDQCDQIFGPQKARIFGIKREKKRQPKMSIFLLHFCRYPFDFHTQGPFLFILSVSIQKVMNTSNAVPEMAFLCSVCCCFLGRKNSQMLV